MTTFGFAGAAAAFAGDAAGFAGAAATTTFFGGGAATTTFFGGAVARSAAVNSGDGDCARRQTSGDGDRLTAGDEPSERPSSEGAGECLCSIRIRRSRS